MQVIPILRAVSACLLAIALGSFAGCATSGSDSAVASGPQLVCTTERPIGSHIPQRTCRPAAVVDAEQQAARETMDAIRTAPSISTEQQ